ncbi:hypothetical protein Purlil1_13655 [Purpureocillium lilacinum]|uniref:Uncharacterized protein n=1 Tax=Purpureocillium lilacinum TaxID=33203 RepID=A0ABR0BDH8_PURLI|nr:hypothetical protein Purlil1_13655 [Purpureocillium lilacinum]
MESYAAPPSGTGNVDPRTVLNYMDDAGNQFIGEILGRLERVLIFFAGSCFGINAKRHLSAETEHESTCYCGRCITSPSDEPSHMLRISSTVNDEDGLERTSVQWPHACERPYGSQNDTNAIRQVNNVARDSLFTCSTASLADDYDFCARHSLASATNGEGDDYQKQRRIRLDDSQQNLFFCLAGERCFESTVERPMNILCTGSGVVGNRYIARKHPAARVVVLVMEPHDAHLPNNCSIEIGAIETYPQSKAWDYLFVRNVRRPKDWAMYLKHLHGLLRTGGQIELVDIDNLDGVVCTCQQPADWESDEGCWLL